MKPRKLLERLQGGAYQNVAFKDLVGLVEAFGFRMDRIEGSHRIYVHPHATRPLNLLPIQGKAKAYQVRQFLKMIEEFALQFEG